MSESPDNTRLAIRESAELEKEDNSELLVVPAQWEVAWQEFGRSHPKMKRGSSFVAFVLFTVLGQSLLGIVQLLYPVFPWFAWPIMFLITTALGQMFVIRFAGLAHERTLTEININCAGKLKQLDNQIQALRDARQIKLTAFFVDIDTGQPYPYKMNRYGTLELQKREGIEIEAIVRILNEGKIPTKIHNLSLIVEIEETGEEERERYIALHPEEKDGEQNAEFDLNNVLRLVSNHPNSIIPKLSEQVVKQGRPLEGYVRFKMPGMYAEGFPEHGPWSIYITLRVDDDTGHRHFIPMQWGAPPLPSKRLKTGIHRDIDQTDARRRRTSNGTDSPPQAKASRP